MMKTYVVKKGQKPTEEQIKAIEEAKMRPITFDEDCKELSPAMQKAFRCAVIQRNRRIHEKKHNINLHFRHHRCIEKVNTNKE